MQDVSIELAFFGDTFHKEAPRLGFFPAAFALVHRWFLGTDHVLHYGAQVGLKLELMLLETLKNFVKILRRQQLRYAALV